MQHAVSTEDTEESKSQKTDATDLTDLTDTPKVGGLLPRVDAGWLSSPEHQSNATQNSLPPSDPLNPSNPCSSR